jgi:VWFA-related protein
MGLLRWACFFCLGLLCFALVWTGVAWAQETPAGSVVHVQTKLVVLDATVLDRAGHVVQQPLAREDFVVEEDHTPQAIYAFEAASEHVPQTGTAADEKAPLLLFVLDELNYEYRAAQTDAWNTAEAFAEQTFERQQLMKFLRTQPEVLPERTEVLAFTYHGFHVLTEPTRKRDVVLDRLARHDPGLPSPYRHYLEETGGSIGGIADRTLTIKSMQGIWALALQQKSFPGRKHVVWLGYGGPNAFSAEPVRGQKLTPLERYARDISDALVDARVTLDILGPGIGPDKISSPSARSQQEQTVSYQYESDFGFSGFIHVTGGKWQNGNDVNAEIQTLANYTQWYYTLSYRPTDRAFNGDFRHIRVTVKGHPEWTVMTKGGYYAMPPETPGDEQHQMTRDLSLATLEPMPFSAIEPTLEEIRRVKGTDKVQFTFRLDEGDLTWRNDDAAGMREADVAVSGAALGAVTSDKVLGSQIAQWKLTSPTKSSNVVVRSRVSVRISVPPKTKRLRFAVRDMSNGHVGTVDVDPAAVAAAPEVEEPAPAAAAQTAGGH